VLGFEEFQQHVQKYTPEWGAKSPACLAACPAKAISKRDEDGSWWSIRANAKACRTYGKACPYGAPQYGAYDKMQKYDLCLDKVKQGKKAECELACTGDAIYAGPLSELSRTWAKKSPVLLAGETQPSMLILRPK
jgi:anaerobic dimethyl sulfoxide reductase subunit B (iron-sulfur subunit)